MVGIPGCMMGAPLSPGEVSIAPLIPAAGIRLRAIMGAPAMIAEAVVAPGVPPGRDGGAALALAMLSQL